MGNQQVSGGFRASRFSNTSTDNPNPKGRFIKEHKRHGAVTVKINSTNSGRRLGESQVSHVITPKGSILYGSLFNPAPIQRAIGNSTFPILVPGELLIPDSRAHKLLVTYCQGWHLIPFPEVFSRHSGTCLVIGDRNVNGPPFQIKVGDCFRLGSVGLVVSEMKIDDENEHKIDARTLQFLKDEALAFDTNEDLAALATDEMNPDEKGAGDLQFNQSFDDDQTNRNSLDEPVPGSPNADFTAGLTGGEKFICYMCYETHNTPEDPLIAPCECKGDTRFLHVHCLQKWYHTSAFGSHSQVVRTTGNGAPACKICGAAYKTNFKRQDGRKASILELENSGPYLSLVVVTHHDTNPGLFNTKFRLNFGRRQGTSPNVLDSDLNTIVIGRSSTCAMILDYRTVSTVHAKISYQNGKFHLSDNRSSNGTMVYIREPLPLPYSQPVKIRMGRTTLSVQAKRSWTAAMRSFVFGTNVNDDMNNEIALASQQGLPSPTDVMNLIANLNAFPADKNEDSNAANQDISQPNFLQHRSYTIRTINEGSVEGVDFDRELPRFHDFNFTPDRFFTDLQGSNSQGQLHLTPSQQQLFLQQHGIAYDENVHNRIFTNNNNNSNRQSTNSLPPQQQQMSPHGLSPNHSHAELMTEETLLAMQGKDTEFMKSTAKEIDHVEGLKSYHTIVVSNNNATEPFIKESDLNESQEDNLNNIAGIATIAPSPPRSGGGNRTIVVGDHIEGDELLQKELTPSGSRNAISSNGNNTTAAVSQKTLVDGSLKLGADEENLFSAPAAGVFAIPGSNQSSHRRLNTSSPTPVPANGMTESQSVKDLNNNNNSPRIDTTQTQPNNTISGDSQSIDKNEK